MDLTLNLKKEYFDKIKSGEKKEEYRLFDKWYNRLYHKSGEKKEFDNVVICLGYPKSDDTERRLKFKFSGFHVKRKKCSVYGNKIFKVFAIKLGCRAKI